MKRYTLNGGFTLIEAMIAVTILTLAVAGPLFTANRAIVSAEIARDRLTALYLAQEGIEYVRAMRDNEYLAARTQPKGSTLAWTNFLTNPILSDPSSISGCRTSSCALDPVLSVAGTGTGLSLRPCGADTMCRSMPLLLVNGVYALQSGSGTPFMRSVQIIDIPGTESNPLYPDKRVVSKVSWDFHGTTYTVSITDHLTPWQ